MIIRRETKQRQMVLQAVQARKDHPTADQIFNDVHKLDPKISHGTVYRNLNLLCEEGLICHVRVPGADRYDLRTDLHYHMFCVKCKKVIDAPHPYKPYLDEEIAKRSGYKIIRHRLIFEGVCPECQKKELCSLPGRHSFVILFDRHLRYRGLPLPKRKNQTVENDYYRQYGCYFRIARCEGRLKMSREKKTRCLWLFDKLKRENALTFEEYECLTSVKAPAFSI